MSGVRRGAGAKVEGEGPDADFGIGGADLLGKVVEFGLSARDEEKVERGTGELEGKLFA